MEKTEHKITKMILESGASLSMDGRTLDYDGVGSLLVTAFSGELYEGGNWELALLALETGEMQVDDDIVG